MNTTAPLLMWNVWRSSGSIICTAFSVSWSSEISSPSTTNMRDAALGERLAEGDRLGVDARQQVVGEDDLLFGPGLRLLARRFLVEHGGRERRRAALGLASWLQIGHGVSSIAGAPEYRPVGGSYALTDARVRRGPGSR